MYHGSNAAVLSNNSSCIILLWPVGLSSPCICTVWFWPVSLWACRARVQFDCFGLYACLARVQLYWPVGLCVVLCGLISQ